MGQVGKPTILHYKHIEVMLVFSLRQSTSRTSNYKQFVRLLSIRQKKQNHAGKNLSFLTRQYAQTTP